MVVFFWLAGSTAVTHPFPTKEGFSGSGAAVGHHSSASASPAAILIEAAGTGAAGYSGDNGAATGARIDSPFGVAVNQAGNLYIADSSNHRIRKVDSTGVITTLAGNGIEGFSGDGGPATAAKLNTPVGVAVAADGNLYIADTYNNRIRKVDAAGVITTVAGNGDARFSVDEGVATSASLLAPFGVAVDRAGNIYIADTSNQRVRKVNPAGVISTVAGNGKEGFSGDGGAATRARLNFPVGVAVDKTGNVFIADQSNNRIRRVSTANVITTVAGNGKEGFSGDGGAARNASLNLPIGVAVDAGGNLYIADESNNRIRKVVPSGVIATVTGNGMASFTSLNFPSGVAVDPAGNLYIADTHNNRIRKLITASAQQPSGPGR